MSFNQDSLIDSLPWHWPRTAKPAGPNTTPKTTTKGLKLSKSLEELLWIRTMEGKPELNKYGSIGEKETDSKALDSKVET